MAGTNIGRYYSKAKRDIGSFKKYFLKHLVFNNIVPTFTKQSKTTVDMAFPILFKALAQRAPEPTWVYGTPTVSTTGGYWMFPNVLGQHTIPFKPETLCQWTSLYGWVDDDGVEGGERPERLFSGDLVEFRDDDGDIADRGVITYFVGRGSFGIMTARGNFLMSEANDENQTELHIVGNIHDSTNASMPSKTIKLLMGAIEDARCEVVKNFTGVEDEQ